MILFALTTLALGVIGTHIVRVLWERTDPAGAADTSRAEMFVAGALAGLGLWIAFNWLLALTHTLRAPALWFGVLAAIAAAAAIVLRGRSAWRFPGGAPAWLLYLLPLGIWVAYILWRGVVLPVASHDALAYHLPKAVLLERAGGWEIFDAPDWRITKYPVNYELLLADVLILGDTDAYTEWIGTVFWLLLLATAAAFARRMWRSSLPATLAAVIATGGAPVLLLHSGAHKNDLLLAWLSACALLWGSRWVVHGGRVPMLLTIVALGLGLGTKTTVLATALGLAPFFAVRTARALRRGAIGLRDLALTSGTAAVAFVLGGGFMYAAILLRIPKAADLGRASLTATELTHVAWGDWSNLWRVPILLLTVPFSSNPQGVRLPWSGELWFWPHYEIYFSHYGRLFTLLVIALPFVLWKFARRAGAGPRSEMRVLGFAALLAVAIMLPTVFRPVGLFATMARYFAFVVPIVPAMVLPPLADAALGGRKRLAHLLLLFLAAVFTVEAGVAAAHDRFAPIEYALWAAKHPGTRTIYFYPRRAGSIVDRLAGPTDTIAVDGAFDTWVYPAYGAGRKRPVVFLAPDATADDIPAEAKWVIVDRSWNAVWSNPRFENLGQMWQYIQQGRTTGEDTRLLRLLLADPRFRLVARDEKMNQAVFRRVAR